MIIVACIGIVAIVALGVSFWMLHRNNKVYEFRMEIIDRRYTHQSKNMPALVGDFPARLGEWEDRNQQLQREFDAVSYNSMLYSTKPFRSFFKDTQHESLGFLP